jgi:hypothetical protein
MVMARSTSVVIEPLGNGWVAYEALAIGIH